MSFENLKLDPRLLRAINACHYKEPTEIQRQAIPVALAGQDLMASAQTGTGKTAAFVLPALQRLLTPSTRPGRGPRVLVLTPTRELAMQVSDNIRQFGRDSRLVSGSIVGGMSYGPQERLLRQPLDLLVATPGRLMDHMQERRVDFGRLEVLVLDEADRMLDMGFVNAVRTIAKALPAGRQTLLFSATLEGKVLDVARALLRDPVRIQLAGNRERHAAITQQVHEVDDVAHKHALLAHILKDDALYQAVIFTATKRGADKLAKQLSAQGHAAAPLHGNMNQNQRRRTIESMHRGEFRLLVATDVAARGLDVKGVSHVINFDLPMVAEDYIHRIGRTGRAGATGIAISLVDPEDRRLLRDIERLTGRRLERQAIAGLEPKPHAERPPARAPQAHPHAKHPHHGAGHKRSPGPRPGAARHGQHPPRSHERDARPGQGEPRRGDGRRADAPRNARPAPKPHGERRGDGPRRDPRDRALLG